MPETFDFVPKIVFIAQSIIIGLFALVIYYGISLYVTFRRNKKLFAGVKGSEKHHWFFGSFRYVSFTHSVKSLIYLMIFVNANMSARMKIVLHR